MNVLLMTQHLKQTTIISSIFNFSMIWTHLPNQISGVAISTRYPYMALSNKSLPTQRISKTLWILWQGISPIRRLTHPRQTIYWTLMVLAIPSRTSFLQCTKLTGTHSILTTRPRLLGQKYRSNSLQGLLLILAKVTRIQLNTSR